MTASTPVGSLPFEGGSSAFTGLSAQEGLVLSAIFLAVCSLGGLGAEAPNTSDIENHGTVTKCPRIMSPSHASTLAHLVVSATQDGKVNDLFALQAILALQLYLYASRALRPAMHLSGILTSKRLVRASMID